MNHSNPLLRKVPAATVFALCAAIIVSEIRSAPPVRDRVLEDVQLVDNDGSVIVEVQFAFPLRYLSHFPLERGHELRVRLHPVRVPSSDVGALSKREGVVPQDADTIGLDDVIYEGDIEGGPYLTLRFRRPVTYQVIPGADYRSINIVMTSIH